MKAKSATIPMTSGSIWKSMVLFAMPIFIGNLFQQMYNTVDSLIVGIYLGSEPLAAVSSSGSLIFMLVGFLSGVASGAGVVVARFFGAQDTRQVKLSVHTTVVFGFVMGVFLTIIGVWLSPVILRWMGTPESVMDNSVAYLRVYFMGSLFSVMYNVFVGILQAVGDSRHPLYYLIISSVVNLVLDIVFISFFHMGVEGAAWATVISQIISMALCLIQLLRTEDSYKITVKELKVDPRILKQIVSMGLPSGVQNSIIGFANVVVQSNVNAFGSMAMAGYGVAAKIEGFGFLPITAFAMALTTFVGQNLGAREYERTKKAATFGIVAAVLLAELIGIIVVVFATPIVSLFDSNPEVVQFGVEKSQVAGFFYCLLAFSHAVAAVLRGAGKAFISMMVMIVVWCGIRVSFLSIFVPLTHNIQFVYWVYPLTWGLSSLFFFFYYKSGRWLKGTINN